MVLSLDRPLRTAVGPEAWAAGTRDAQWLVLGGLHTRPAMVEQPEEWAGIQLSIHPLGVRRLLGVPASGLPTDRWDARDLLGVEVERVVDEVHLAEGWEERYAAVHRFLLRQLARHADRDPVRPEVRRAWHLLTSPADGVRVQDAADHVGYSRRRLGQLFAAEVGQGPKTVGRLARFDAARRLLTARAGRRGGLDLAGLAAGVGYYDQSHLVRDFHEYAGLGPTAWLAAEFPNLQAGALPSPAGSNP